MTASTATWWRIPLSKRSNNSSYIYIYYVYGISADIYGIKYGLHNKYIELHRFYLSRYVYIYIYTHCVCEYTYVYGFCMDDKPLAKWGRRIQVDMARSTTPAAMDNC